MPRAEKSVTRARPGRPRIGAGSEKVSISLDVESLAWARRVAAATRASLSSVVDAALKRMRQREARERLLAELGGDDIPDEELQALYAEWRAAGLEV